MGQKVNPKGFRIGANDLWNTESQCYGKGFRNQKKLYKKVLPNINALNYFFESKLFIKGNVQTKINDNKWQYNVQYVPLLAKPERSVPTFKMFDTELKQYNATSWNQNGALLCGFIKFALKKGSSLRKIINTIKIVFFNKEKHKIVVKTASGIQFYEFTGIKIKYAGRFGGSRSRMSSSVVFSIGAVSLQKLDSHIEFYETPLNTKQGICNLQVWMAYKTL